MGCSMSIELKLCKEKKFQLQSRSNVILWIDKLFAAKNLGISCLALKFNLSNPGMTMLHAKIWIKVTKYDQSYTFFQ